MLTLLFITIFPPINTFPFVHKFPPKTIPPFTLRALDGSVLYIFMYPPIFTFSDTPIPPLTTIAPVPVSDELVEI